MRFLISTIAAGTFASLAFAQPAQKPNPLTREFPGQKCRFTLPEKEWTWQDPRSANFIFAAATMTGFKISLQGFLYYERKTMDQFVAQDFERGLHRTSGGNLLKRGSRFVIFQGLPCYQFEGVYKDGRTMVCRVFLAHGAMYDLMLIGGNDPVEQRQDFEKIMSGFEFTDPAAALNSNAPADGTVPTIVIGAMIVFVFGVGLTQFARKSFTRKPAPVLPLTTAWPTSPIALNREPAIQLPELATAVAPETVVSANRSKKPAAECQHCGFQPVDQSMETCPNCGKKDPTPGIESRCIGFFAIGGAIVGCLICAACLYVREPESGVGALIGAGIAGILLGLTIGLIIGLLAGAAIRIAAKR